MNGHTVKASDSGRFDSSFSRVRTEQLPAEHRASRQGVAIHVAMGFGGWHEVNTCEDLTRRMKSDEEANAQHRTLYPSGWPYFQCQVERRDFAVVESRKFPFSYPKDI